MKRELWTLTPAALALLLAACGGSPPRPVDGASVDPATSQAAPRKPGTIKVKRGGGYYKDKVVNTFASVFPANDPKYVLVVTLDEPVETTGPRPRRTAGWTAVPVAAEIIRRAAPLLGMRPQVEAASLDGLVAVKN